MEHGGAWPVPCWKWGDPRASSGSFGARREGRENIASPRTCPLHVHAPHPRAEVPWDAYAPTRGMRVVAPPLYDRSPKQQGGRLDGHSAVAASETSSWDSRCAMCTVHRWRLTTHQTPGRAQLRPWACVSTPLVTVSMHTRQSACGRWLTRLRRSAGDARSSLSNAVGDM